MRFSLRMLVVVMLAAGPGIWLVWLIGGPLLVVASAFIIAELFLVRLAYRQRRRSEALPATALALFVGGATLCASGFSLGELIQSRHWPLGDLVGTVAYFNSALPLGPCMLWLMAFMVFLGGLIHESHD